MRTCKSTVFSSPVFSQYLAQGQACRRWSIYNYWLTEWNSIPFSLYKARSYRCITRKQIVKNPSISYCCIANNSKNLSDLQRVSVFHSEVCELAAVPWLRRQVKSKSTPHLSCPRSKLKDQPLSGVGSSYAAREEHKRPSQPTWTTFKAFLLATGRVLTSPPIDDASQSNVAMWGKGRLRQGALARIGGDGRSMKKTQHGNPTHPLPDFFPPHIFKYYVYIYFRPKHCLFFFFSGPHHTTCRILGPQPGIKPKPSAVETCSCNHWTAKDVLKILSSKGRMFKVTKILRGGVSSILQTPVNIKYFYTPVIPPNAK